MPLNHKKVSTIFSPVFFAFRGSFANFGALKNLRNEEYKTLLSDLYKYINNKRANKENWYDSLYEESTLTQEQIKYQNTCELINKFVAYCDIPTGHDHLP